MNRIIIQLDDQLLTELDRAVEEEGSSRAAVVREAISLAIGERIRRRELDQIVRSYQDVPQEKDFEPWPE